MLTVFLFHAQYDPAGDAPFHSMALHTNKIKWMFHCSILKWNRCMRELFVLFKWRCGRCRAMFSMQFRRYCLARKFIANELSRVIALLNVAWTQTEGEQCNLHKMWFMFSVYCHRPVEPTSIAAAALWSISTFSCKIVNSQYLLRNDHRHQDRVNQIKFNGERTYLLDARAFVYLHFGMTFENQL